MRNLSYRSDKLRALLRRNQIATLDENEASPQHSVDVTVFRKLKPLDYLTSYSHRSRYYTLREIARFDDHGLWSHSDVLFSRSARCWPPPKCLSIVPLAGISPMNWRALCTSQCRTACIS